MSGHTKVEETTVAYECSQRDCGHDAPDFCPTEVWEICEECTRKSWEEHEGPVVLWPCEYVTDRTDRLGSDA